MPGFTQLHSQRAIREPVVSLDGAAPQSAHLWRAVLGYTLIWCALLQWASLNPGSFWFASSAAGSSVTLILTACATLTPFFIPFVVYFPLILTKGHLVSFSSVQLSPPETRRGYLRQVVACSLLTLIPLLSVYVLFALMSWLGLATKDTLAAITLGRPFLICVASLTLLTSATASGLAMSGSRAMHLIAVAIAVSTVTLPFILSELVTGSRFERHLVTLVEGIGDSTAPSIFLLLSALLMGSLFSWLFRRKQLLLTRALDRDDSSRLSS